MEATYYPYRDDTGRVIGAVVVGRDITEQRQAQEAALEREAKLAALIENTADRVWAVDSQCRLIIGNSAFQERMVSLFGRRMERGELIFSDQLSPQLSERWRGLYARALGGEQFSIETPTQLQPQRCFLEIRFNPIRNEQSEITGVVVVSTDITERKVAADRLRQSEETLNQAQQIAKIGSFVWDLGDDSLTWSSHMYALAGLDPDRFSGKLRDMIAQMIHPADKERAGSEIASMVEQRRTWPMEFRLVRPDGRIVWLRSEARFELDAEGVPVRSIGIHHNITESKRVRALLEVRLLLSEYAVLHRLHELLQKILDEAEVATESQIGFFHFVEADQKTLSLQTWSTNTLKHMCNAEGAGLHYSIDQAGVWVECFRARQPLILNNYAAAPNRKDLPQGHAHVTRMMSVPVIRHGTIVAILGVGNKVTDYDQADLDILSQLADAVWEIVQAKRAEEVLRKSEQQYRVLTETMQDVVWVLDTETMHFTYVSPSVEELLGYSPAELKELPFHVNLTEARAKGSGSVVKERIAETLAGPEYQGRFYVDEVEQPHKNGSTVWTEMVSSYHFNPETGHPEIRGVTRDIRERRRFEQELCRARDELEQRVEERTADLSQTNADLERALRAKDEFLATMSHELRTPLNTMLMLAEILREEMRGPLNERQADAIKTIDQSGHHLLDLINDILTLSELDTATLTSQPGLVEMNAICEDALKLVRGGTVEKNLDLTFQRSREAVELQADPLRLKQILVNLLSNAIKFTPDGGQVRLEVMADAPNDAVHLIVQDNGIGIPKEFVDKVFQPFFQVDSSLSRHYEGAGLGLALVHRLVDLHGGSVALESEGVPGKGSRFTVSLPWRAGNSATATNRPVKSLIESSAPCGGRQKASSTILLADDNEIALLTISDYLQELGYRVVEATNGIEAIDLAMEVQPDLILMDIQMPVCDGLTATQILRTEPRCTETPIIALTALVMPGDRERCLAAGATDYVAKPVSLKTLAQLLEHFLNIPKAH